MSLRFRCPGRGAPNREPSLHGARRTTTVDPRYSSVWGTNRSGSLKKPAAPLRRDLVRGDSVQLNHDVLPLVPLPGPDDLAQPVHRCAPAIVLDREQLAGVAHASDLASVGGRWPSCSSSKQSSASATAAASSPPDSR